MAIDCRRSTAFNCRMRVWPGCVPITIPQTAAAGDHLKARMNHARDKSMFEALMEVAHLPKFFFDPALLDQFFEIASACSQKNR